MIKLKNPLITDKIGPVLIITFSIAIPLTFPEHGYDWRFHFSQPPDSIAQFIPYYGYMFLWPLTLLPEQAGWIVLNVLSGLCFIGACRLWGTRVLLLVSVPSLFFVFSKGQIEGIIALGVALAVCHPSPYLRGVGVMLALLKPHLTILPLVSATIRRWDWRVLIAPVVILIASFCIYGLWPIKWLQSLPVSHAVISDTTRNIAPFGWWSLLFTPVALWLFWKNERQLLAITPFTVPYYAFYSLSVPFTAKYSLVSVMSMWLLLLLFGEEAHKWLIIALLPLMLSVRTKVLVSSRGIVIFHT
jgi:hypothetical protein